jgi:RimJ/RimL family protein N-acetyltransferase
MVINWQPTHLSDERVTLIPLEKGHFEELYQVASDPLIWEQHPDRQRYQPTVFQTFFEGALASDTAFLLIETSSGEILGTSRFYGADTLEKSVAIGYTFMARKFWGGSYNYSAKKLMLDYAFQFVDKVFFHVGLENFRSQTAVRKLGASEDSVVEFASNGPKAMYQQYVLTKSTWLGKSPI